MTANFILLNYLVFFCSLVGLLFNSTHFLLYMVSLEFMYLSVVCGFSTLSVFLGYGEGIIYALFCLGLAAVEAVVGFFFSVGLFKDKQILLFIWFFQLKG